MVFYTYICCCFMNMKNRRFILLSILCLLSGLHLQLRGQNYGNEWINPSQNYFKFKVGREGIYRIDFTALSTVMFQSGIDLSTIDPRKIQIFNRGEEIPLYIRGEENGVFNFNDFIEFYAFTNDGKLDRELYYNNPQTDPLHNYESIFTDTAVYFLTYLPSGSSQQGKRFELRRSHNLNNTQNATYFIHESKQVYNDFYYPGHPMVISGIALHLPEYTQGEGYVSRRFGFGPSMQSSLTATLAVPSAYALGPTPKLEFKIISSTRNANVDPDHHFKLSFSSNNNTFNELYDTTLNGYGMIHRAVNVSAQGLASSSTAYFKMEAVNISGVPLQGYHASFLSLRYARTFNLAGFTQIQGQMPPSNQSQLVSWTNYGIPGDNTPLVFDLTNNRRITPEWTGNQSFRYVLPPSNFDSDFLIADSSTGEFITQIEPVQFAPIQEALNNTQFVMITHQRFLSTQTTQYLNYRRTSYAANLYTVQQLYDLFSFGVEHPIAIRRFLAYLIDGSQTLKPEYLLFLGRGIQPNLLRNPSFRNLNYVPTLGTPASDVLFSAGLGGKNILTPYLATGRISADNPAHIGVYLNKLMKQEQSPDDFWKKQIMHLGGGKDGSESRIIRNFLESFEEFPRSEPFGGNIQGFYRSGTDAVSELNLRTRAINLLNEGVSMVTFLGHGSATVLDIDIGDTADYANEGKAPIMYFNGCQVGNPAIGFNNGTLYFGERMIRANNKGGIVFMGQSSLSELYTVAGQMREFYRIMFRNPTLNTSGKIHRQMLENNINLGSFLSRYHNTILFYQGDPAFRFYRPELPDYFVTPTSLFLEPGNVNALSDSFSLGIIVGNMGKYTPGDSFEIDIKRTWPNQAAVEQYTIKVPAVAFRDTFYYVFKTKDIATTGNNQFEVIVNPNRSVQESDFGNNEVKWERFIEGNGISLLYPRPYAIHYESDTVTFTVQSLNLLRMNNQFIIEVDTSPLFNSPWLRRTQPAITAGNVARWNVGLIGSDSTVYYWRARLNLPTNQGGFWESRSFIHIQNGTEGWSQSHHPQFYSSSSTHQIDLDSANRRFEFGRTERFVYVDTRVNSHSNLGVKFAGFLSRDVNPGAGGSFVAVLLDRNTLQQFLHPNHYPKCWRGALWPPFQAAEETAYYCFGTSSNDVADFEALMNDVPDGTYVALFTRYDSRISEWSERLKNILRGLGGSLFEGYQKNQTAYVLIGKKGAEPGSMFEDMSHLTDDATAGYAAVEGRILGRNDEGYLYSSDIGPANQWHDLFFDWRKTPETPNEDKLNYSVYGIDTSGNPIVLYNNMSATRLNLSSIDANRYRYLRLRANFEDRNDRSAPQIRHWLVSFSPVPEGTINTGNQYVFHKDTLMEGDSFRLQLAFENISNLDFDSMFYEFDVVDLETRTTIRSLKGMGAPIPAGDAFLLKQQMATRGLSGNYAANISFNTNRQQPEVSLSNNLVSIPFKVINDHINPLLDVSFDGRHIINGEIVSPNPLIVITSKDENPYLLQNDSSNFEVMLKWPGEQDFRIIDISSDEILFRPASGNRNTAVIEYRPTNLPDGNYTLKVQSADMSGNQAGREYYSIEFRVINESTITQFYPYPNPFTSQMRFVFTLTGTEIPDEINITIMTVSGRVVREIRKEELGTLRIGNNISEFTWDGTDQFGDILANGVYFYTVDVRNHGERLKRFETAGDNNFKKDVGKIYILR